MHITPPSFIGHLEVICGPMYSGKTEELIRRATRANIARQKLQIFKHSVDVRYHKDNVVSHSARSVEATCIQQAEKILDDLHDNTRIVIIDEAQFFQSNLVEIVNKLLDRGLRVICAGLDQDFRGLPFGPIPNLLAMADEVIKLTAICTICGAPAGKTQRIIPSEEQVLVGEKKIYEARCRAHYENNTGQFQYYQEELKLNCEVQREGQK